MLDVVEDIDGWEKMDLVRSTCISINADFTLAISG